MTLFIVILSMANFKDITQLKYNKLTAISKEGIFEGKMHWKFLCNCGNTTILAGTRVTSGATKTCGCSKRILGKPSVYGIGYYTKKSKNTKAMYAFKNMIERCYSEKFIIHRPSYINATVCKEWLNFNNFELWFNKNYIKGWQLDKDILSTTAQYSSKNCIFIPSYINNIILNTTKENITKKRIKIKTRIRRFISENPKICKQTQYKKLINVLQSY